MENLNSKEYLEKIRLSVIANLERTKGAPSVQMTDVPREQERFMNEREDMLDDLDEEMNTDSRHSERQWDKKIEHDGELSDSEDEEALANAGIHKSNGEKRRRNEKSNQFDDSTVATPTAQATTTDRSGSASPSIAAVNKSTLHDASETKDANGKEKEDEEMNIDDEGELADVEDDNGDKMDTDEPNSPAPDVSSTSAPAPTVADQPVPSSSEKVVPGPVATPPESPSLATNSTSAAVASASVETAPADAREPTPAAEVEMKDAEPIVENEKESTEPAAAEVEATAAPVTETEEKVEKKDESKPSSPVAEKAQSKEPESEADKIAETVSEIKKNEDEEKEKMAEPEGKTGDAA